MMARDPLKPSFKPIFFEDYFEDSTAANDAGKKKPQDIT